VSSAAGGKRPQGNGEWFLRVQTRDRASLGWSRGRAALCPAFTELQAKVIDTQQKVKLADVQIEQLNRTKKHAHLTDTEIMTLVDETNMYEGVGRMFILQSKEAIHNQLLEKQKIAEEKIKELEQKKSYLERSVKEAEDNIREMLMARRAQ
uniref:Prefoldin subunit 1 n=1 Tax=Moschus moschiferus TaxID=68415 RepID=A0A8C6CMM4_MOSMO